MASVRKREWTYEGQTKEAWIVDYLDAKGKRRQKTFPKKKDADKYRLKVENELREGRHVAPGDEVTIEKLCELYLVQAEDRARDGRIGKARLRCLRSYINTGIIPYIGDKLATSLTSDDMADLYSKLCRERKLSPLVAKERIRTMKMVQDYALRRKLMFARPVSDALEDLQRISKRAIQTFTTLEVRTLLEAADKPVKGTYKRSIPLLNCIVHLAAFCGLRYGEIAALREADLDLDRRVVIVRRAYSLHDGMKGPKTKAGNRDVPLPPHLVALIRTYLRVGRVENDAKLLFTTSAGTVIRHQVFHQVMWHPLLRRAGLYREGDVFHFHALRHFAASWWIENGMSPLEVSKLVGHANVGTTLSIYAHKVADDERRNEQLDRMSETLMLPPKTLDVTPLSGVDATRARQGSTAPATI